MKTVILDNRVKTGSLGSNDLCSSMVISFRGLSGLEISKIIFVDIFRAIDFQICSY